MVSPHEARGIDLMGGLVTSLRAVASYWPPRIRPVSHYLRQQGFSGFRIKVYEKCFGFSEVREAWQTDPAQQLLCAVEQLEGLRGNEHRVRYVLQARAMPTATPHPVSTVHEVRRALGLDHAAAFCVNSHGCASGLLAVDLAGRLLAADGGEDALALIVTGEKVFTAVNRVVPDVGVMGECAAALLVGLNGPHDRMLSYASETRGDFEDGILMSPEMDAVLHQIYPVVLASVVLAAVGKAGLVMDDIDLILPHNINRMSWLPAVKRLGISMDRVYTPTISLVGHCFGADTFLNYLAAREHGRLQRGMRYVMTAVGDAETFSAMVFEH